MEVTITKEYKPTIEELAKEIWSLDAEEQLLLLNELNNVSDSYYICMQMQNMADENKEYSSLYREGCIFVALLNDYLNHN